MPYIHFVVIVQCFRYIEPCIRESSSVINRKHSEYLNFSKNIYIFMNTSTISKKMHIKKVKNIFNHFFIITEFFEIFMTQLIRKN